MENGQSMQKHHQAIVFYRNQNESEFCRQPYIPSFLSSLQTHLKVLLSL